MAGAVRHRALGRGGPGVLAIINEAFAREELPNDSQRTVLRLKPHLAPIKVAVLPLKRNHEGLVAKAGPSSADWRHWGLGRILYEHTGNIGKGYRRHDEVGTPMCVTVDFQTLEEDDTVTVRDRDSMAQVRVPAQELESPCARSACRWLSAARRTLAGP